jgi:branched-chain amino acid transport system ATP-binding protein
MILEIKNIIKYFNGFCALMNVELDVQENTLHAIIGPNGAGKTTLFNLISGMYDATQGEIAFRKTPINGLKPHQRAKLGISRTFQIVRLFGQMSVLENVMLGNHCKTRAGLLRTFFRVSLKELEEEKNTRQNAMRWLEFVGIAHKAGQIAVNLPHAEQRLVEIARALSQDPDLLLFDEPAAGM